MVAFVTDRVEQFQREARDVNSIRQKVEQFDMKNAELVSRLCVRLVEDVIDMSHDFAPLSRIDPASQIGI